MRKIKLKIQEFKSIPNLAILTKNPTIILKITTRLICNNNTNNKKEKDDFTYDVKVQI